ncbi:MAG: retropepsin-like domain-containing protein [Proteobacteria bacterium]|nr:retropepsin-like domain-containing protein [Pseudomonadota bacterium]
MEGKAGRIPVRAIIDTGAERTLGNALLRDALIGKVGRDGKTQSRVIGATDAGYDGTSFKVPMLRIGAASLYNLPVTFGDMHVFEVWGLTNEPAVLIGMDLIGKLRRFVVDYGRWEVHLMPTGPRPPTVRKCGPTECRSRIPEPDRM